MLNICSKLDAKCADKLTEAKVKLIKSGALYQALSLSLSLSNYLHFISLLELIMLRCPTNGAQKTNSSEPENFFLRVWSSSFIANCFMHRVLHFVLAIISSALKEMRNNFKISTDNGRGAAHLHMQNK